LNGVELTFALKHTVIMHRMTAPSALVG